MLVRGPLTSAGWPLAVGLALAVAAPRAAWAAPPRCDRGPVVAPSTLPEGVRTARVRVPPGFGVVWLGVAGGTLSTPVALGTGSVHAELQVDPGVSHALVGALGGGACGFTVVRVASPEGGAVAAPQTLLMIDPPDAAADHEAEVLVHVYATDESGNPRRGPAPELRPSTGQVSGLESIAPGAWRARWRVPAGQAAPAGIEARFGASASGRTSLERRPGAPAVAVLTREGPEGAGEGVALLAVVRDAVGNPVDATLQVESSAGTVDPPARVERGVYRITFDPPWTVTLRSATITIRADHVTASATIHAPQVAVVRVARPRPVRAGVSATGGLGVLEVEVLDASGAPVNVAPSGEAPGFEFRQAIPAASGQWGLPFRPPRVLADTTRRVTVTAGDVATAVDVELVVPRPSFQLGAKVGVAAGAGVGPAAGLEGAVWTVLGGAQLGLVLDVGWWSTSQTSTVDVGGVATAFESTQGYVPLILSVAWRAPVAERWMLWATLGGGGAVVSTVSQVGTQAKVGETGFAGAASGSLSVGPRVGPGFLFLEARGTWVGDPGLSSLSGSVFEFLGFVGYRFDVG